MKEEDRKSLSLAGKIARIGMEVGAIKKDGHNTQQQYNYIEYGVVAGRIRELFDKYGIVIKPQVLDYKVDEVENKFNNKGYHYILKMQFTIINADDKDDTQTANWLGESTDYSDKGITKAETSGVKYFLMRLFNISEKGEKEADSVSPKMVSRSAGPEELRAKYEKMTKEELRKAYAMTKISKRYSDDQRNAILKIIEEAQETAKE